MLWLLSLYRRASAQENIIFSTKGKEYNDKYVGLDKKDSLTWLRADVESKSDAMTVKFIPAIDPNAKWGYCTSKELVPEQVNVQLAGPDSVVISWVTFGDDGKFTPPTATVNGKIISGVTHTHRTAAGDRTYLCTLYAWGIWSPGKHTLTLSNLDRAAP